MPIFIIVFLFQGCFFDGQDDSAYGLYFVILPILFIIGAIVTGISFIFVKGKKKRIFYSISIFSPFIVIYIISTIHYFPGFVSSIKRNSKRPKEHVVKKLKAECNKIFLNFPDDEMILFAKENIHDNFVVLNHNAENDMWNESYRFEIENQSLSGKLKIIKNPAGNDRHIVACIDEEQSNFHKYHLALFMKKEKWELVDVVENPYCTEDISFAVLDDLLAVANTIRNQISIVSIYKMSDSGLNLIQTIEVADHTRKCWNYSTQVCFYKNELIVSDLDFNVVNAAVYEKDFDGCGKLTFYSIKDGKFQESQIVTYRDVAFDRQEFRGLGYKIEPADDDCLIINDTSKKKIAIRKTNDRWACDEKTSIMLKNSNQKDVATIGLNSVYYDSGYNVHEGRGVEYFFDDAFYCMNHTAFFKKSQNGKLQQIVLNPKNEKFYTQTVE